MAEPAVAEPGSRRVGIEVELLCPPEGSRTGLAERLAARAGSGSTRPAVHFDTELSAHAEIQLFHNLTPAVEVLRADGALHATLRDDSSIVDDLAATRSALPDGGLLAPLDRRSAASPLGRIVSDDRRLLRILANLVDPADPTGPSLGRACDQLGLTAHPLGEGRVRVVDGDGETVAVTGILPHDRARVAEVVSPPLTGPELRPWLDQICGAAAGYGCTGPVEGAVHLHFDAVPFDEPARFEQLVSWFDNNREPLRHRYQTNLACRTLGPFGPEFLTAIAATAGQPWFERRVALYQTHRSARGDVNLRRVLHRSPAIPTIEMRFLPVSLDPAELTRWAWELGGVLALLASGELDGRSRLGPVDLEQVLIRAASLRCLGPSR